MDRELITEYENPAYPVQINFVELTKEDAQRGKWEVRNNDIELIIVNNGELKIACNDKVHRVFAGQGAVLINECRHRITSSSDEDTAFFSIVFDPGFAVGRSDDLLRKSLYESLVSSFKNTCLVMDEANLRDGTALDKINAVVAANTVKKPGYEIVTKSHLCMLWAILYDFATSKEIHFNGRNVPSQDELRVKSAIAFMEEYYQNPITLEDIAEKIHVSRNECCRCFKRVLFITPVEFLVRLRVFQAAKVLYKDPLSVNTISRLGSLTGFNNTSYFNRMFKRYLECTPREFSRMLKSDPEKARKLYENLQGSVTGI